MNTSTFLKKEGSWQDADASSRCGNRRSDDEDRPASEEWGRYSMQGDKDCSRRLCL